MMNDQIEENREKNTSYTNYVETDSFALSRDIISQIEEVKRKLSDLSEAVEIEDEDCARMDEALDALDNALDALDEI